VAKRIVDELTSDVHGLDEEEMSNILHKVMEHAKLQNVLPNFMQKIRNQERCLRVLERVKFAYDHMATNRSSVNLVY
jgi:hypothetical protein